MVKIAYLAPMPACFFLPCLNLRFLSTPTEQRLQTESVQFLLSARVSYGTMLGRPLKSPPSSLDMHIQGDIFIYSGSKTKEMVHFKIPCKRHCFSNVLLPAGSLSGATKGTESSRGIPGWRRLGLQMTPVRQAPCTLLRSLSWGFDLRQNYKAS